MIDLEPIIQEAGGRGLSLDEHDRATAFLNAWHDAGANGRGYVPAGETVRLADAGRSYAHARIVQTARGHWLAGYDFSNSTGSSSGGPSVWNCAAYERRDEAIRAVAADASKWFAAEIVTRNSCVSETTRREAAKMVERLKVVIDPPTPKMMQLDLFG